MKTCAISVAAKNLSSELVLDYVLQVYKNPMIGAVKFHEAFVYSSHDCFIVAGVLSLHELCRNFKCLFVRIVGEVIWVKSPQSFGA